MIIAEQDDGGYNYDDDGDNDDDVDDKHDDRIKIKCCLCNV